MGATRRQRRFAFEVLLASGQVDGMRVRGHCMNPILKDGEQVSIRSAGLFLPGDLVAAFLPDGRGVAHRVMGYALDEGHLCLVLKADVAVTEDPLVQVSHVLGKIQGIEITWSTRARSLLWFGRTSLERKLRGKGRRLLSPPAP
jgi:hypothetical protein